MSSNVVLVVSPHDSGAELLAALAGHSSSPSSAAAPTTAFHIDNRYYTAELTLHAVPLSGLAAKARDDVQVVLMHLCSTSASGLSVAHVKSVLEPLGAYLDACAAGASAGDDDGNNHNDDDDDDDDDQGATVPETVLLVCPLAEHLLEPAALKACQTFCLDRNAEFVGPHRLAADSQHGDDDDDDDDDGGKGGSRAFREKFGMERVAEALHAHMWPEMELKTAPARGAKRAESTPTSAVATPAAATTATAPTAATATEKTAAVAPATAPAVSTTSSAPAAAAPALESTATRVKADAGSAESAAAAAAPSAGALSSTAPTAAPAADNTAAFRSLLQMSGLEGEALDDAVEQLLAMRRNAASLPDEERKDVAARVALSFWSAMALEDGDEDDEDELGI